MQNECNLLGMILFLTGGHSTQSDGFTRPVWYRHLNWLRKVCLNVQNAYRWSTLTFVI